MVNHYLRANIWTAKRTKEERPDEKCPSHVTTFVMVAQLYTSLSNKRIGYPVLATGNYTFLLSTHLILRMDLQSRCRNPGMLGPANSRQKP